MCKWQQHHHSAAAQSRQGVPIQQTLGFPSQRPGGLRERRKVHRWGGDGWMRKRGALSPWSRCRWQRQLRKLQYGGYHSIRERFMCCAFHRPWGHPCRGKLFRVRGDGEGCGRWMPDSEGRLKPRGQEGKACKVICVLQAICMIDSLVLSRSSTRQPQRDVNRSPSSSVHTSDLGSVG